MGILPRCQALDPFRLFTNNVAPAGEILLKVMIRACGQMAEQKLCKYDRSCGGYTMRTLNDERVFIIHREDHQVEEAGVIADPLGGPFLPEGVLNIPTDVAILQQLLQSMPFKMCETSSAWRRLCCDREFCQWTIDDVMQRSSRDPVLRLALRMNLMCIPLLIVSVQRKNGVLPETP